MHMQQDHCVGSGAPAPSRPLGGGVVTAGTGDAGGMQGRPGLRSSLHTLGPWPFPVPKVGAANDVGAAMVDVPTSGAAMVGDAYVGTLAVVIGAAYVGCTAVVIVNMHANVHVMSVSV